ncbi:MAG: hypothetical protein Q9191_002545 [Dirinaria sp. TL-2023a]
MDFDPRQNEDAKLLSTSRAIPLKTFSGASSITLERLGSTPSRNTSFENSYQPVQEPAPVIGVTSGWRPWWDRLRWKIEEALVNRWLIELSACGGSLLALITIAVFLHNYDGRAQPDWPHNVTINSVLSWFTTIMKALMLVSVASCLSQANWIHFKTTPHAFKDFLVYDSASRGPKGSLQLLWGFRVRYIASVGAIITILALAVDPTVQQMVSIRSEQRNSTVPASLGRAQSFLQYGPGSGYTWPPSSPTSGMLGAIYSGIFFGVQDSNAAAVSLDMNPSCATGNCTFPPFQSLATCSTCEDVSQALVRTCPSSNDSSYCQFSLPNGLKMNKTDLADDLLGPVATSGYLSQLENSAQYGNTFFTFTRIRALHPEDEVNYISTLNNVSATQCLLYWCVNTYKAQVTSGQLSEEVKGSWYSNTTEWWFDRRGAMNDERIDLIPPPLANHTNSTANPNFTVGYLPSLGITEFLAPKLTLSNSYAPGPDGSSFGPDETNNASSFTNSQDLLRIFRDSDMDRLFENLAKSMTRNIRDANSSNQANFDGYIGPLLGVGPANGTASYDYIYVSVRWGWLTLSAALVLLTIMFLVLTIAQSTRHDVAPWKSSPVPLLFNGLDENETERLRKAKGVVEMERLSRDIKVELKDDSGIGSGVRLVR